MSATVFSTQRAQRRFNAEGAKRFSKISASSALRFSAVSAFKTKGAK